MIRTLAAGCAIASIVACADPNEEKVSTLSAQCAAPVTQTIRYDEHGRKSEIQRADVGAVHYAYHPVSGLLAEKALPDRTTTFAYDASGRLTEETATGAGRSRTLQLHYDENGELGFLTRVSAAGWEKRFRHRRDGTVAEATIDIPGFRSVTVASTYYVNGFEESSTRVVRDAAGNVLSQVDRTTRYDDAGRPSMLMVNGQPLYTLYYDPEGRLEHASFTDGSTLSFTHDPETHLRNGYQESADDFSLSASWSFDQRGLIVSESFDRDGQTYVMSYVHDARGFLTDATGPAPATYQYGADGRPTNARTGTVSVNGITYAFDASGRVIQKGDLILEYGPSGDVEQATLAPDSADRETWTFDYDEAGRRILKRENGAVTAAYLFGGYLDGTAFIDPVYVDTRLVGVLIDDAFVPLGTDPRGSVVAGDGAWDWPTPYGARVLRPAVAAAVDYAEKGFDPDLGTVRMGIRDYDPDLGQFWGPDPLFFEEDPTKCIESPVECNLFSYASNDPTRYRDPSGRNAVIVRNEDTHTITIRATISIWGSKASDAVAQHIESDIESTWGQVKTWTDARTGQVYDLQGQRHRPLRGRLPGQRRATKSPAGVRRQQPDRGQRHRTLVRLRAEHRGVGLPADLQPQRQRGGPRVRPPARHRRQVHGSGRGRREGLRTEGRLEQRRPDGQQLGRRRGHAPDRSGAPLRVRQEARRSHRAEQDHQLVHDQREGLPVAVDLKERRRRRADRRPAATRGTRAHRSPDRSRRSPRSTSPDWPPGRRRRPA